MTAKKDQCERCGKVFAPRVRGDSPLCPGCRARRDQARTLAYGRTRTWLAAEQPEAYASLYAEHHAKARAEDPGGSGRALRDRARSRVLGELQRQYPDHYQRRYEAELARAYAELDQAAARADQEQAACTAEPRVPYWQQRDALAQHSARTNATARLRALLWLADRHPDDTAEVFRAQAARLPLDPADRTPERRRALAWAVTLDRLARLHPADFEARYQAELSAARRRLRAS
jgi:hypothetical protein